MTENTIDTDIGWVNSIRVENDHAELMKCSLQAPSSACGFSQAQEALIRSRRQAKTLVPLLFPPKCGGTFLREVLGYLLSFRTQPPEAPRMLRGSFLGSGNSERDLYFPELLTYFTLEEDPVALLHNHPTATDHNLYLIDLFRMRPVIMKRAIPDMLRSLYDAALRRGRLSDLGSGFSEGARFFELPLADQKDFIVFNVAPWYVRFYASWFLSREKARAPEILWLTYEDFRVDNVGTVQRIFDFFGISPSRGAAEHGVQHARNIRKQLRFNRGASGRGADFLEDRHHDHLRQLTKAYSTLDFETEGLL